MNSSWVLVLFQALTQTCANWHGTLNIWMWTFCLCKYYAGDRSKTLNVLRGIGIFILQTTRLHPDSKWIQITNRFQIPVAIERICLLRDFHSLCIISWVWSWCVYIHGVHAACTRGAPRLEEARRGSDDPAPLPGPGERGCTPPGSEHYWNPPLRPAQNNREREETGRKWEGTENSRVSTAVSVTQVKAVQ